MTTFAQLGVEPVPLFDTGQRSVTPRTTISEHGAVTRTRVKFGG
jgi:hypothetical protein